LAKANARTYSRCQEPQGEPGVTIFGVKFF
jgi:hypothetical protein